jgi:hypothetical protein
MVLEESQLYRDLMRLKPEGWTANAWAVRAGVSRTVWTDMRRHGNPSRRTLEKLLAVAGSSLAEFEALRIGEAFARDEDIASGVTEPRGSPWHSGALPALPLIAASGSGSLDAQGRRIDLTELRAGAILERLPRPASLAGDPGAYALAVVSDAMWPRFHRGRRIAVSPKAAVEPGDDVLVTVSSQPDGRSLAFVAELVGQSAAGAELRQFHPGVTFAIPAGQFTAIEKVMGELF